MKSSTEELDDFATGMDFEWRTELGCLRAMDPESIVLFREEGRRTNVYEEAAGNSFILGFVQGFTEDVSWRKAVVVSEIKICYQIFYCTKVEVGACTTRLFIACIFPREIYRSIARIKIELE